MKKFLFLDFDGVINSHDWAMSPLKTHIRGCFGFDSRAVERINQIVERTGCLIVISSSWRRGNTLETLRGFLVDNGFRHPQHGD